MSHSSSLRATTLRRHERSEQARLTIGSPLEIAYEFTNGDSSRNDDCEHYKDCLRFAVDKGWDGFSCSTCSDYVPSDAEVREAAKGIGASMTKALSEY